MKPFQTLLYLIIFTKNIEADTLYKNSLISLSVNNNSLVIEELIQFSNNFENYQTWYIPTNLSNIKYTCSQKISKLYCKNRNIYKIINNL